LADNTDEEVALLEHEGTTVPVLVGDAIKPAASNAPKKQ
jgi:hypothetical protein